MLMREEGGRPEGGGGRKRWRLQFLACDDAAFQEKAPKLSLRRVFFSLKASQEAEKTKKYVYFLSRFP